MNKQIKELYLKGHSTQEVKDLLGLTLSTRAIQRQLKAEGIIRTVSEAHSMAIKTGRIKYFKYGGNKIRKSMADTLRYAIMKRDGFRCILCGRNAQETRRLEVDHKDGDTFNRDPSNLQTLCAECNYGKARYDMTGKYHNGEKYRKI